jgi:glyoxylase-like metal-dependent hydrolase (beta-lactamase superfamily II)
VTWNEIVAGVFCRQYPEDDITITVVRGTRGLLLVDTGGSPTEAARIDADVKPLGEVGWVVNTHAHYDHTFGNQHFTAGRNSGVQVYGHHLLAAHLDEYERPRLAAWQAGTGSEPPRDWHDVIITPPTHVIRERSWLDLGDRAVELIPLNRGHTDGDLVIRVPARRKGSGDTWIVGDVMEEPGPPMYGSGCFPMQWPQTLATLLEEIGEHDLIVPGHGRPISRAFGISQLAVLESTAALMRQHYRAGQNVDQALAVPDEWAYSVPALRLAVQRGYQELELEGEPMTGSDTLSPCPRRSRASP